MMDFLIHLQPGLIYPSIFAGVVLLGGIVLLTAMYMAYNGALSLFLLYLTILTASVVIDSIWYLVGMRAKKETIYEHRFLRSKVKEAKRFSKYFDKHGALLVFITKFVYGTRLASHILAGAHRVKYFQFLFATSLGTTVWFGIFYALVFIFNESIGGTKAAAFQLQLFFLVGVAFLLLFNWISSTVLKKRIFKSRS